MRVGITGASGLIGTALSASLTEAGHTVVRFVRHGSSSGSTSDESANQLETIEWDIAGGQLDPDRVATLDAVVHLAGAGIADHRWTDAYRQTLVDSRVDSTRLLAETMAKTASGSDGPRILLNGSAIGYYGNRGDEVLTEASAPGTGFLPELCTAWEAATAPATEAGLRVAMLRTGIVLSARGGALSKLLPMFKLGLGGRFGDGKQWMSWIAIDDHIRAVMHVLTTEVEGPINLTAPNPQPNKMFAEILAGVLSRPSKLPVPRFGPRLLLGRDLANSLLFESQRVLPASLLAADFEFRFAELEPALRHLIAGDER